MSFIPVNDPPPPDDFHTWARPVSPPCPDCQCCTAALCQRAIVRDTACHHEGQPGGDFDLSRCPCWRQDSPARRRLTVVAECPAAAVGTSEPMTCGRPQPCPDHDPETDTTGGGFR